MRIDQLSRLLIIFSSIDTANESDRQTDRQTDGQTVAYNALACSALGGKTVVVRRFVSVLQAVDKLPAEILKMVMSRALTQLSVYKSLMTQQLTTLACLSTACRRAVTDLDVRRRAIRLRLHLSRLSREQLCQIYHYYSALEIFLLMRYINLRLLTYLLTYLLTRHTEQSRVWKGTLVSVFFSMSGYRYLGDGGKIGGCLGHPKNLGLCNRCS